MARKEVWEVAVMGVGSETAGKEVREVMVIGARSETAGKEMGVDVGSEMAG